jgi:hypothetical protein
MSVDNKQTHRVGAHIEHTKPHGGAGYLVVSTVQTKTVPPREWMSFRDPADPDHEIRADLTWLLSTWSCIFGAGCRGISADAPDAGCCTHGAFFSDSADEKRVRAAAKELTAADWQLYGTKKIVETDELDGEPARRTRTVDGACIFHNRGPGAGCALHGLALRTGRHPVETKPDVCWQVPISCKTEEIEDTLGPTSVTTVTEYERSSWGEGGADLHWWCTESPEAHGSGEPLFRSYAVELTALLGEPAYQELARLCERRRPLGLIAVHPAEPDQGSNL